MNAEKFHRKTEKNFICQTLRGPMLELAYRRGLDDDALFDSAVSFNQAAKYTDNEHELGFTFTAKYDDERRAHVYTVSKIDVEATPFALLNEYTQASIFNQLQNPDDATCEADTDYYLDLINLLDQPADADDNHSHDADDDETRQNSDDDFVLMYRRAIETVYEADEDTFDITKQIKITHLLQNDVLSSVTVGSHSSQWGHEMNDDLPPEHLAALLGADNSLSTLELKELKEIRQCLQQLGLGDY